MRNKMKSAVAKGVGGKKKIYYLSLVALAVLIAVPIFVKADGGLVHPPTKYVYENEQQAVIFYEDGVETLAISIKFEGNADDFGWLIPTPNKPEVDKVSRDLFVNIDELTERKRSYSSPGLYLGATDFGKSESQSVTVIEEKTIDYYDITVLQSTDSNALSEWLNEHDYEFPEKYNYLLEDYIKNEWYLVAVKIDPSAEDTTVTSELKSGQATPLMMIFETENIVYPMKLSQISAPDVVNANINTNTNLRNLNSNNNTNISLRNLNTNSSSENSTNNSSDDASSIEPYDDYYNYTNSESVNVELYIIADHKKSLTGFSTSYANKHSGEEIKELADDEQGNPWITPESRNYWVTRMSDNLQASDMKEDLFVKDADDNTKVGAGPAWYTKSFGLLLMLLYIILGLGFALAIFICSPFGLLYIIPAIILIKLRTRGTKIACMVLQIISMSLVLLLLAVAIIYMFVIFAGIYGNHGYYSGVYELSIYYSSFGLVIASVVFFIVLLIVQIIVTVKLFKRQKRLLAKKI